MTAYAAAVNYCGTANVAMSYMDNCLAVTRLACRHSKTGDITKLTATDIKSQEKELLSGGSGYHVSMVPKLWHVLYMVTEQDVSHLKVVSVHPLYPIFLDRETCLPRCVC